MDRSIVLRALMACVIGLLSWGGVGDASAQALNCTANIPTPGITVLSQIYVNRLSPLGEVAAPRSHTGARITCTGGTMGMPIEVAYRVHPTLTSRVNPFGPGVLIESAIPGLGIIVTANLPSQITAPLTVVWQGTRTNPVASMTLPNSHVFAAIARHGDVDLLTDHALHGVPILQMGWRSPGTQDEWQWPITWSLNPLGAGQRNIIGETCYIGGMPNGTWTQKENLGSVPGNHFPGIGEEAPGNNASGTVILTCRNYAGGRMTVDSATKHSTMPGVLRNSLVGAGSATGIGLRVRAEINGTEWDFLNPWEISPPGFRFSDTLAFSYYARFVQLDPVITPGKFKATVTFTVHYD